MPGIGGLSVANNLLSNAVQLHLNNNQKALQQSVTRLSSGLRINTAADDPSGLAIAEKLQAQVNGFDQASRNVQDANNAATVAEGALQTTTDILQRIRSLAVEAANDITSASDKENLQTEVSQLLLEVNRIAEDTQFNGIPLLDGSHAGFQPEQSAFLTVTSNAALASAPTRVTQTGDSAGAFVPPITGGFIDPSTPGLLIACVVGIPANFMGGGNITNFDQSTAGNGLTGIQGFSSGASAQGYTVDGTIEVQVIDTGVSIAAQETFFVSDVSAGQSPISVAGHLLAPNTASILFDNVGLVLGNFSTIDVGATAYIKISQNVPVASNPTAPALSFQSGAAEGATIDLGIAAVSTAALRIGGVNLISSSSANPSINAEDAIGQVDNALQTLLTQRANIGAVIVRLNEDEDNDNVASVNQLASESTIRDLNVAAETTNFNRLQILVQVGTAVLAQGNANAQSVLRLFP